MTSPAAVCPTPWLDVARGTTALVAACRRQAEETYRMAPEVRRELGAAGLFRLAAPVDHGRGVPSLEELIRIHEELAFADPSVAWASINSNGGVLLLRRLPGEHVAEVLGPSTTFVGVGLPPTGRAEVAGDRLRVSGRWPVVSGSSDADWFVLHCVIHDDRGPEDRGALVDARFVPVPRAAVAVEDTWRGVTAVRGSGSNAVSVEGHEVDRARAVPLFGGEAPRGDALAAIDAHSPFAFLSLELAAVAAGVGRAALAAAVEQASRRVSVVNQASWSDWASVQNTVATAQVAVDGVRSALFGLVAECQRELEDAGALGLRHRALAHASADHALRTVRHAVSDLFTVGSVDALRAGHGLEQALRDIHGFSVQWERYRRLHYAAGRVLLGAEPEDPLF